jgi:hypothetical protein
MKKNTPILAALGSAFSLLLFAAPAQAQATRTWVSGVGDDINPCSRTAPCKTFAGAISKTFINGEIDALDAGAFGTLTITKSINVDCHDELCGVLISSGITGFIVNIAAGNVNDPLRNARIRNVNLHGGGLSGGVGSRLGANGVRIISGLDVALEDLHITDVSTNGIRDERTTGGRLTVTNTTVRNCTSTGILSNPSAGSTKLDVSLDHVIAEGNGTGITAANGGVMSIKRSMISNNLSNGLDCEGATTTMTIDNSLVSNNGLNGLFTAISGTLRVSNTDITNNATAASGAWTSFGNNRVTGNAGTAPTAAGAASTDLGQK